MMTRKSEASLWLINSEIDTAAAARKGSVHLGSQRGVLVKFYAS